jgi:plasmid stability protein
MATVTIRNVPDEVHRAIRVRAARHGRSTEAEIREILARSVQSGGRLKLGTELRRFGEKIGGVELSLRRKRAPIDPASFE